MTAAELQAVVEAHGKWRRGEPGGSRAYLTGANLTRANLAGAYLTDAYLTDAYLTGAYLTGANLTDAYLTGAYLAGANLAGANLTRAYLAGANLAGANLAGANLTRANLTGAIGISAEVSADGAIAAPSAGARPAFDRAAAAARYRELHPEVPFVPQLDAKILEVIESGKGELDMGVWHSCATTHCRAGWAITLAGAEGAALEDKHGSECAGAMIYRASTGRVPYFFAADETALEDIRRCAAEQKTGVAP